MHHEYIEKRIFKDNYINLAFNRYLQFQESPLYDENYKLEILEELNAYLSENPITKSSVANIAKKIKDSNPSTGSFVHWSNTDDLVRYAEQKPDELADVWNHLYDNSHPIDDRIEAFREKAQTFQSDISLGAPLFGYLLAAYDYTSYPLYKGEIYKDVKATYEIAQKMGSVSENYAAYFTICKTMLEHMSQVYPDLNMLDIQDFLYCMATYHKIRVETAVDYLYELATTLAHYKEDPSQMIEGIKALDHDLLQELRENYRDGEKVRQIRFKVMDQIITEGSVSISDLEGFQTEVSKLYDTNILHSWNNFTILFHLFYYNKTTKVQQELGKIHQSIRQMDELESFHLTEDKTLKGFNWNQAFGGSECWLAVYETKYTSHRSAPQFFVMINGEGIRFGLVYGDNHPDRGIENIEALENNATFTFERLEEKMTSVAEDIQKLEGSDATEDYRSSSDALSTDRWLNLLDDKTVFHEDDLTLLKKMYERGGEASATELATALGRHFSSFNKPVVELSKRIYQATGIEPFTREDGTIAHWTTLFNGKYETTNRFTWILKTNLHEAVAEYVQQETKQIYTKQHFLDNVFIDEPLYDTIVDLLDYKKNIILQGPPGVGKTFLAKRLAYSLVGEKDNSRVGMVQFHQNYAYEDFVMGFRPREGQGFGLDYGVFYDFCKAAEANPEMSYYFIIDEINRGNLSKIFGELFMLMEGNKRDEYITMSYSKEDFTIPSNVYLIGTMNTADHSLARLETALRRRFAFITLEPQFNNKWENSLLQQGVSEYLVEHIRTGIENINEKIREDFQLGPEYEIGHSFFTNAPENMDEHVWLNRVMAYEIKPLLEEYYFDRPEEAASLMEGMTYGTNV